MRKVWITALLCAVLLSGCNIQKISEEPAPSPENTEMPRLDVSGNPIKTLYAEGVFVKAEENILTMTENEETKQFILSERAAKDIQALGILEGTKIIVNYNGVEEGMAEAISLEKLL